MPFGERRLRGRWQGTSGRRDGGLDQTASSTAARQRAHGRRPARRELRLGSIAHRTWYWYCTYLGVGRRLCSIFSLTFQCLLRPSPCRQGNPKRAKPRPTSEPTVPTIHPPNSHAQPVRTHKPSSASQHRARTSPFPRPSVASSHPSAYKGGEVTARPPDRLPSP